jgi:hypothetical protein
VQATPVVALIKGDRLLVYGFDESWGAEAIVKKASHVEAHLTITKVFGFAEVGGGLYSDGNLEVFWDGSSYGVRRLSDKVPVGRGFATEGMAIDALRRYYPTRVVA